ncbi:Tkl/shk protein kinase [Globisporangium polare]
MALGMHQPHKSIAAQMTVCGMVDYFAPETIKGKVGIALYGEAAEVYALAITLWDIAHPWDEKNPEANNDHFKIFEAAFSGKRPPISEFCYPEADLD